MGVAAFMHISVVLWNTKDLRKSGAKHQVLVHTPTAEDPYNMVERFWGLKDIIDLCKNHPGKVAQLVFNGVDHGSCSGRRR